MIDLSGKVGFVTGGGTGIGLACAKRIVEGGGKVAIGGRRLDVVNAAASELGAFALAVQCDVTDQDSVDAAVAATVEHFGGLHIAVNAAGVGGAGHILNSTAEQFAAVLDTNLTGVFRSMHAEVCARQEGRVRSLPWRLARRPHTLTGGRHDEQNARLVRPAHTSACGET